MKVQKLIQGSKEWHEYRAKGLGGSDSCKLMGSLPFLWGSVTDLWKDKMGLAPDFVMNDAVQFGMDNEDNAREYYEQISGYKVHPDCHIHDEHNFLRASLDGITKDGSLSVEIKVPSDYAWESAKKGIVKDYYYTQMQHQMLVSGSQMSHYWVFRPGEGAVFFEVYRNEEYMEELIVRAKKFWNEFVIPEICPVSRDFGMNDKKATDMFKAGSMETKLMGFYPVI